MEHIYKNHMSETAPLGKSYFLSESKGEIRDLVYATRNYPDYVSRHSDPRKKDRKIYIRNFGYEIGRDGYTDEKCKRVQLVYDFKRKIIITAFPIV